MHDRYQIIAFYAFTEFDAARLAIMRDELKAAMRRGQIRGTIILACEGFNGAVCGKPTEIEAFVNAAEAILNDKIVYKSSFSDELPFRRVEVKIKPEIVTLKRKIRAKDGIGSHVKPAQWNKLISDPDIVLIDARNDYEFKTGTFRSAINPETAKFSEIPDFIASHLDPRQHKKVAMFCTGGIRCEKLAPYMKGIGFEAVYQLEGGILKYLEEIPESESLWEGECFVFDTRVTVDGELRKGKTPDLSQRTNAGNDESLESTVNSTLQ